MNINKQAEAEVSRSGLSARMEFLVEILMKMTHAEVMWTVGKDFTAAFNETLLSIGEQCKFLDQIHWR
jgi:hypothetical protein